MKLEKQFYIFVFSLLGVTMSYAQGPPNPGDDGEPGNIPINDWIPLLFIVAIIYGVLKLNAVIKAKQIK